MAIILRSYRDSDYNAVIDILKEADLFSEYFDNRESLRKKVRVFPGSIIVASTTKQVVGCVYALNEVHSISHLAVRKKFRNLGIATMLLKEAEKYLIKNNTQEWTLFTFRNRKDLHDYYIKRGYEKGKEFVVFTKRK